MGGARREMVKRVVLYEPNTISTVPDGIRGICRKYGPLRSAPNPISLVLAATIIFGPPGAFTLTRSLP